MEKIKLVLETRHFIYSLLQHVWSNQPTEEQLLQWKERLPYEFLREVSASGGKDIQIFFESLTCNSIYETAGKEREEYNRLFYTPGNQAVPMWESTYVTNEKLLFDFPTIKVREMLKKYGFEYIHIGKEPEDHISVELDFMDKLIEKSLEAVSNHDEIDFRRHMKGQKIFLENHLTKWIGPLATNIMDSTSSLYY